MLLKRIQRIFGHYDWILSIVIFILTAVGLAAVYSVDLSRGTELVYFPTQFLALGIGTGVFLIVAQVHRTRFSSLARWVYVFGLLALVAVLFLGAEIRGTRGWFRLGGFSFQPAEFAKLALILLLGWLISKQRRQFYRWEFVVASGAATLLYVGAIMMQPDLGSATVLLGIWFGLLVFTGAKKRYIFGIMGAAILAAIIGWFFLFAPYQKERVLTFLSPERDPLGSGYNVTQSMIAIGSGKFVGRGLGFGSQSQLHFLPEAQTDFILAVVGEELGFVGVFLILALYATLLSRLGWLAMKAKDDFTTYTLIGIALLFLIQILFNVGGATGLLPVTGVTLPFVSYGGSSLIMNFFIVGIASAIATSKQR